MAWKQPALLWLLLIPVGLRFLYRASLRGVPARGAVRFPLALAAAEAARHAGHVRRHLAAGAFMLAIAVAFIGAAGPIVPLPAPTGYPVVLMIDVSRSMEENDIKPSRIEATKSAALDFVGGLPRSTKVALVSFGNYATLVVPLTSDRAILNDGIRNLTIQLRTQLGNGLMEGLRAVTGEGDQPAPPGPPRAVGVLMSDGRASDGIPPPEAAQEARRRGVRVYTVGVGTNADPRTFRSGYFGVLDEPTLRAIAAETGGEYFRAYEAGRLREIYRHLSRTIGWERRPQEVTAILGGMAMLLLVTSVLLRSRLAPIA